MTSLTSALLGDFVQYSVQRSTTTLVTPIFSILLVLLPRPKSHVRVTQESGLPPEPPWSDQITLILHAGLLQCHGFHRLPILLINAAHQSLVIAKRGGVLRL